jgi:hypothetical protein
MPIKVECATPARYPTAREHTIENRQIACFIGDENSTAISRIHHAPNINSILQYNRFIGGENLACETVMPSVAFDERREPKNKK